MVSSRQKVPKVSKSSKTNGAKKTRSKEKITATQSLEVRNVNSRKRPSSSTKSDDDVIKRPRLDENVTQNSQHHAAGKKCKECKGSVGIILTFGQGDMGQLGLGDDILSRKKPALIKELSQESISMVVAGGLHTLCITTDNKLYSFGCNDESALGRVTDENENSEYLPRPIVGPLAGKPVVSVTAGDSHSAVLTDMGEVFLWGTFRDSHGSLGLFTQGEITKIPTLIESIKESIISIASGDDHLIMVSHAGTVYSMGCGEQGQLGRIARYFVDRNSRRNSSAENTFLTPMKVAIPKVPSTLSSAKIIKAFCSSYSSWALTSDGSIFAWGLNNCNQLGFSDNENRYRPQHCPQLSAIHVKQINGGLHHTLILSDEGEVYSMGLGQYGRLGLGEKVTQADEPIKVRHLHGITSISARSNVSFAVSAEGSAFGWGMGTNLQLSTGTEDDEWIPVKLSGKNIVDKKIVAVAAGGQHTVLLSHDSCGLS